MAERKKNKNVIALATPEPPRNAQGTVCLREDQVWVLDTHGGYYRYRVTKLYLLDGRPRVKLICLDGSAQVLDYSVRYFHECFTHESDFRKVSLRSRNLKARNKIKIWKDLLDEVSQAA